VKIRKWDYPTGNPPKTQFSQLALNLSLKKWEKIGKKILKKYIFTPPKYGI